MTVPLAPPLRPLWRSDQPLARGRAVGDRIYGITPDGRAAAFRAESGALLWRTGPDFLPYLGAAGRRILVYRRGRGLARLTDLDDSAAEEHLFSLLPCDEATPLTDPIIDAEGLYIAVRSELFALTPDGRQVAAVSLSSRTPFTTRLWKDRLIVVVDGLGQVQLFRHHSGHLSQVWAVSPPDPGTLLGPRPCELEHDRLYTAANGGVLAATFAGRLLWQSPRARATALAARGSALYGAAAGRVWSLDPDTGAVRWLRACLHPAQAAAAAPVAGLAATEGFVYVGHLSGARTRSDLAALRADDGLLLWQAPTGFAGLPVIDTQNRLVVFGPAEAAGALTRLPLEATVRGPDLTHDPRLLRGPASAFAGGRALLRLKTRATVTLRVWQETAGLSGPVAPTASLAPGTHTFGWDPTRLGETPGLARLVAEVAEEGNGLRYAVAAPLPVNTLPDLHDHWGAGPVETMLYHRHVDGYPDLTFRPDLLITRAESAAIVARTLGLTGPSPGFRTRFTDMAEHWAERAVLALEERGVLTGYREPDGSYTFRPSASMTRAEEARTLTRAYSIPPAPLTYRTRFADIAGHWAEADILALEAGGYTEGFREPDSTHTYRPDRPMSRAELCALVVRIRRLRRGGESP